MTKYEFRIMRLWWQKENLMFTASGYGRKIPTEYMVKYLNRWRRVYCSIFSNSDICYFIAQGQEITVDSDNF
jgi:hypothetical protein